MRKTQSARHATGECIVAHVQVRHETTVVPSRIVETYTSAMTSDSARPGLDDPIHHLRALVADVTVALDGDLATPVPDCPGWSRRDLVAHLGRVYGAVCTVVESRATEPVRPGPEAFLADGLADDAVRAWFDERVRSMLRALESVPPSTPLWTWSNERTAGFYRRRMVHETAVHLADLSRAAGHEVRLDRAVCVDGIDEYFDVMLSMALARPNAVSPSGSLHLHCTDGPGEWLIVPSADGVVVTREHAKGAVAWRGPAKALLLAVWGRLDPELDVVGDASVSSQWLALAP